MGVIEAHRLGLREEFKYISQTWLISYNWNMYGSVQRGTISSKCLPHKNSLEIT